MDPIKEAFLKIKEEISFLKEEINQIKNQQSITNELFEKIQGINKKLEIISGKNTSTNTPTDNPTLPTNNSAIPTDNPTINNVIEKKTTFKAINPQNMIFSIGNDGVPTNKPTNQQTNQQMNSDLNIELELHKNNLFNTFERANYIISTLDDVKKEIRRTFKNLTNQEMQIFSTLYRLDEQKVENITYKKIADILNLSESSIRDYTNKLINKGILIEKRRINNKRIVLNISMKLKELTNLHTILKLREI